MFNQVLYTDFTLVTILTHSTAQTTLSAIDSSLEKACHLILGFENQYSSLLVVLFIVLHSQKHNFSPFKTIFIPLHECVYLQQFGRGGDR